MLSFVEHSLLFVFKKTTLKSKENRICLKYIAHSVGREGALPALTRRGQ